MKKSKSSKSKSENGAANESDGDDFLIVGIGASAGGIQALKSFFGNVPADSGAAYVVILHLSPEHESRLAEVLQTSANISVTQVTERVKVEPNHVFVVPPNQSLTMVEGHIVVSPINTIEERRAPVDIFFRTLAETHHEKAVCVVLSGTGADGSMGLKRVKENGGVVFVQNPREAEYSDMARNAIATNLVDEVLNVAEIPAKIVAYRENRQAAALRVEPEAQSEEQQKAMRNIFTHLRVHTGHDFSNYKRPTILRRIERRINVVNLSGIAEYAAYLKEQPPEVQSLLKNLLISVTNFFRDKQPFAILENKVIPRIVENKRAGDQIRVWVAGCATGEEAYSLAMLLAEQAQSGTDAPEIQIFASDIDEAAIATARDGFYTINDAADVSPERLRRFFKKEKGGYRIRRELREMVLFANHNVLKDPPFSRLDMATCRNMLIYLNHAAQKRVMETFHFTLKPDGFLFLGASESIDGSIDLFAPVSKENNIFQRRSVESRVPRVVKDLSHGAENYVPTFTQTKSISQSPESEDGKTSGREQQDSERHLQAKERLSYADLHQHLVEQYAPPSVVVNEDYDILHLSERAGRFMQIQGGEPSNNLLKMIRPELRLELRTALYQAVQKRANVEVENLTLKIDDRSETINIHVRPVLRAEDTARGFILVIFEKTDDAPDASETVLTLREPVAQQLEEELIRVKSQFRSGSEQYEIQTEELKASNEELQAINEELRSSGEELETGKEELQSINEELTTVNQELKIKIEELSQSNSDFQNLMASSDIGTIFLDRSFRVKMFTPATRNVINLLPADLGRPLTDITTQFAYENLRDDCELVLEKLQPVEREIETGNGRWFLLRILPYRTAEDQISGVVLTFLDITERFRREAELKDLNRRIEQQARIFNTTLTSISDFAYIFDRDGRFVYSNKPLLDLLGITLEEIVGKNFFDLNYPEDLAARLQKQIQKVIDTKEIVRDETPFTNPEGKDGFYEYIFTPVFAADGSIESVAGSTRDITKLKRAEINLKFLAEISQDLAHLTTADEIMRTVGAKIGAFFNLSVCAFTDVDEAADEATITHGWHRSGVQSLVGTYRISEFLSGEFQRLSRAGETFVVSDTTKDSRVDTKKYRAIDVGAFVTFPIVRGGKWLFHLVMFDSLAHDWQADEIEFMREITARIWTSIERRRSDEAVRQSEEKFRRFINVTSDVVYQISADWRELRSLDGKKFIYLTEEANENWLEEYIPESDRRLVSDAFEKAIQIKSIYELEHRVNRLDGLIGWVFSRAIPVLDETGEIVEWLGAASDITERKRTEELLREAGEFSSAVLSSLTAQIAVLDADGGIAAVNEEWRRFARENGGEHALERTGVGVNYLEVCRRADGSSLADARRVMAGIESILQGELAQFSHEYPCHSPAEKRWFLLNVTPLQGGRDGAVVSHLNITTRKLAEEALRESEERARVLVEGATDFAIFKISPDNIIETWNTGAEKVFGWKEADIIGQSGAVLFTPEDRTNDIPEKEKRTAAEKGRAGDERWHIRKDGTRFFASGVMMRLMEGAEGFVKICRDQTDRIEIEKAERDKEMLQKLVGAQEDERKRIARDLHDELGQLLTGLRLKLESVRKLCEDEELCGKIDETQRIAKHLDEGIDFLAWELRPAALDDLGLNAALAKYVKEWSHYAGVTAELLSSGIKKARFQPEVETNLYRIAQEALNNVHKHAKAKSVEIVFDRRGDSIVLIIEDDGKGFKPENKMNRSKGIGLIGMRERAALVGGSLEIESAPGKGTTIYVRVPASNVKREKFND